MSRLIAAALLGLSLGAANSLSNALGSPYSPVGLSPEGILPLQVLAAVLGTTWAWSITAFLAGWLARRIWAGPVAGMICLLIADLTYYFADRTSGYAGGLDRGGLLYWGLLAIPCGLGMGLLGALAAQRRWWSLAPSLAGPVIILLLATPTGTPDIQPWSTIVTNTTALILALAMAATWTHRVLLTLNHSPHAGPERQVVAWQGAPHTTTRRPGQPEE